MPLPTPREGESRGDFVSRCVSSDAVQAESEDNDQALGICYSQWENKMPNINRDLLKAIQGRQQKCTEFGYGIITADRYVRTLQDRIGLDACYRFTATRKTSFDDLLKKAARTLVYSNGDMEIEKKTDKKLRGLDLPKNTLMVFRHVLTTSRTDRDGDILRSEGAEVDPKMVLLWQHVHTLPIGKMIKIHKQTKKTVTVVSAIVDINELAHDAAVMVDNEMARFSHGFRALEFTEIKGEDDEGPSGFDVKRFEIMEESMVSVPANVDADTEEVLLSLVEGGKLKSPLMKEYGKSIREGRAVSVPVTFKEQVGDVSREIVCGSFEELKQAHDAGLVGGNRNEDESRGGGEAAGGKGGGAGTPKEADDDEEKKEGAGDAEVKEDDTGKAGITVKQAMGVVLSEATEQERESLMRMLKAFQDGAEQKRKVEQYKALTG